MQRYKTPCCQSVEITAVWFDLTVQVEDAANGGHALDTPLMHLALKTVWEGHLFLQKRLVLATNLSNSTLCSVAQNCSVSGDISSGHHKVILVL